MDARLSQLKDIHLPQPIALWPIAPAWLAVYFLCIIFLAYLVYAGYKAQRKKYIVHFALAKLNELEKLMAENPKLNGALEISTLLRRTALHYYPRENIAGLTGQAWLSFLNQSGNMSAFNGEEGKLLTEAPYRKNELTDLTPLFSSAKTWLIAISKKKGLRGVSSC